MESSAFEAVSVLVGTMGVFVLAIGVAITVFVVVFAVAWLWIARVAIQGWRDLAKDPQGRMAYALTGRRRRPGSAPGKDDDDKFVVQINGVWRRTQAGTLLRPAPDA